MSSVNWRPFYFYLNMIITDLSCGRKIESNSLKFRFHRITIRQSWSEMFNSLPKSVLIIVTENNHDDVIKWKHFPRNWPFVREIHRSPVNFPHKGQWRGALMFSLIYAWINDWVNNREAGDLRRQHGHYDVIVMTHGRYAYNAMSVTSWIMM